MEVSVLVEAVEDNGYRATVLMPLPLAAEAPTREEALERLRELVRGKFANAELIRVDLSIPCESHPWKRLSGTWRNHPDGADFERNVEEYRESVDSDPERL